MKTIYQLLRDAEHKLLWFPRRNNDERETITTLKTFKRKTVENVTQESLL